MSYSTRELKNVAIDFVLEYLERTPEYLDVMEFADENYDEELNDAILDELYQYVNEFLGIVSTYVFESTKEV